jgi:selenide,water dikinase
VSEQCISSPRYIEICESNGTRAVVDFDRIPLLPHVGQYLEQGCSPGGTGPNIASADSKLGAARESQKKILCDPQTSGGLLVIVDADAEDEFLAAAAEEGLALQSIGQVVKDGPGALVEISWTGKNLCMGETSQPLRMYIPEDRAK